MKWLNRHKSRLAWVLIVVILAYIFAGQHADTKRVQRTAATAAVTALELKNTVAKLQSTQAKLKLLDSKVTAGTCKKINKLQNNLVSFLGDSSVRSKRNATAIIKSPFSTQEEKEAAIKNLEQIRKFLKDFRDRFPNSKCPPVIK